MAYPLCLVASAYFDDRLAAGAATLRYDKSIYGLLERPENKIGIQNESELEKLSGQTSYEALQGNANCAVKVWYQRPMCSTKQTVKPAFCDANNKVKNPYECADVPIDINCWRDIQVTPNDYNCACGNFGDKSQVEKARQVLFMNLETAAKEIITELNEAVSVKMIGAAGKYYAADAVSCVDSKTSTKTLTLFTPVNGTIMWNPMAVNSILKEYSKQGYNGRIMVAGGGQLYNLAFQNQYLNGASQNNSQPNASQFPIITGHDFSFDQAVTTAGIAAGDYLLTWTPGAYRWIPFYNFRNNVINEGTYRQATISIGGELFDIQERFDECNTYWTIRIQKSGGIFCIPDSAYQPCGCHNHKLLWGINCGPIDCGVTNC